MPLRRSKISWCDYSSRDLNFIIGCSPVSEGCDNCYAAAWAKRCGQDFSEITIYWDKLRHLQIAKWEPGNLPYRRGPDSKPIMFPVDLGDLFHPAVPGTITMTALDTFAARKDADWVLLTKRPYRMLEATKQWLHLYEMEQLPPNIWCLVTAENQRRLDERVPILLQVEAQVRGVSIEPMLGPMNLNLHGMDLQWVIIGAESGPNRRPFEIAWAEDVYKQCQHASVPFFGKQALGLRPGIPLLIHGEEIKEFPEI